MPSRGARNHRVKDSVIYVGPMGCRTGFYLLVRDSVSKADAIALVLESMRFARDFDGEIFGSTAKECGNYLDHDLAGAKAVAKDMSEVLQGWTHYLVQGHPLCRTPRRGKPLACAAACQGLGRRASGL